MKSGKVTNTPSLTSDTSFRKWSKTEISSVSVSSGPKILANSKRLYARVFLTFIRESLTNFVWIYFSYGHAFGPRVRRTAGKLKAQWYKTSSAFYAADTPPDGLMFSYTISE